jgi:hypothetical protein
MFSLTLKHVNFDEFLRTVIGSMASKEKELE